MKGRKSHSWNEKVTVLRTVTDTARNTSILEVHSTVALLGWQHKLGF